MKAIHFIIYLVINVLIIFLFNILELKTLPATLIISLTNILIIFFIQRLTIIEIKKMSKILINVDNKSDIKDDSVSSLDDLKDHFSKINDDIKEYSEENHKPLTISLEAILNSTLDGIILVNNNRDIIMSNDSFFSLCGYRAYEISGKDSTTMVAPENILSKNLIRFIKYSFENILSTDNSITTGIIEINHVKPNRVLKATATPLKYTKDSLDGLVINLKDITKELEANEEKNKFIKGISHEFRTPLFSIMGYSSLLHEQDDLDETNVKDFGKVIYDESIRLSDIIDNLLNITKLDKGETNINLEKFDFRDILESLVNEYEVKIKASNLTILIEIKDIDCTLSNDRENVSTIFSNLLSNAIKFSKQNNEIKIMARKVNDNFIISFANFGELIPEESKSKIFEKFYRVESNVHKIPGAGLGLFISKRIATSHGGDINFDSKENGLITFYLRLPVESKYKSQDFKFLKK